MECFLLPIDDGLGYWGRLAESFLFSGWSWSWLVVLFTRLISANASFWLGTSWLEQRDRYLSANDDGQMRWRRVLTDIVMNEEMGRAGGREEGGDEPRWESDNLILIASSLSGQSRCCHAASLSDAGVYLIMIIWRVSAVQKLRSSDDAERNFLQRHF